MKNTGYCPQIAEMHSAPSALPSLTCLLSADRLAHPEGSLPDLAMMKLTASLEVAEVNKKKKHCKWKMLLCQGMVPHI